MCNNVSDLYSTVLVDTPLAPYFESCMSEEDLNEVNIEIIRNKLWKVQNESLYLYISSYHNSSRLISRTFINTLKSLEVPPLR